MNYIILDMEWNQALDKAHAIQKPVQLRGEIIQIGAVKADEDFRLIDTLKINIAPKYYKIMNRHVEKITGITSKMLANGVSFPQAFQKLREWCGEEFRFITWGFDDIAMLSDNLAIHGLDPTYGKDYVNLQLIYKNQIDNERVQWSLSDAAERLNITLDAQVHDAMNDARYTYEVCKKLDMAKGLAEYSGMSAGVRQLEARKVFRHIKDIKKLDSNSEIITIPCPVCGEILQNGEWLTYGSFRRINICSCPEHGEFLIKINCKRSGDATSDVTRSVYKSDEESKSTYIKNINKRHAALQRKAEKEKQNNDNSND